MTSAARVIRWDQNEREASISSIPQKGWNCNQGRVVVLLSACTVLYIIKS